MLFSTTSEFLILKSYDPLFSGMIEPHTTIKTLKGWSLFELNYYSFNSISKCNSSCLWGM